MDIIQLLQLKSAEGLKSEFNLIIEQEKILIQETKKEFKGDFTIVLFPFSKELKMKPVEIAGKLGTHLNSTMEIVKSFEVVQGFLNLEIIDDFWINWLSEFRSHKTLPFKKVANPLKIMVEYSSPNTNKPLHLGHIRNNLIGYSISEILKARGHEVIKSCLFNDRGANICKSMLSWLKFGNGETPDSAGMKGDFLVGKYYVLYETEFKKQVKELINNGMEEEKAKQHAPIAKENRELLKKWEANDPEVIDVWKKLNNWVYEGFESSYSAMGVDFDKYYYESATYLKGKEMVQEGLDKGVFYKKEDNSVWVDLTDEGLDEKLLLRSDGTAVYITQDLGTAQQKYDDFKNSQSLYVVGNEQDYHFKVLKLILQKLKKPYADGIYHVSYGMVDLPSGKMKSREGTVVDADILVEEMIETAKEKTNESGKITSFSNEEQNELYKTIGLGALKFFILKTDPKKQMLFNPEESIDLQGFTGPFIQYTYARISSVLRKAGKTLNDTQSGIQFKNTELSEFEKDIILHLFRAQHVLEEAEVIYNPSLIAHYVYHLAKAYNRFYHELTILNEKNEDQKLFRLQLSIATSEMIKYFMKLLGIQVPEQM